MSDDTSRIVEETGAHDCVECGKCTTLCPILRFDPKFAPRLIVVKTLEGVDGMLKNDKDIWTCLTCGICSAKCPYKVLYPEFIQGLRSLALKQGNMPKCSQDGILNSIARLQTKPNLKQDRMGWLKDGLDVAEKGDVYYFVGCSPYMTEIFGEKNPELPAIPQSAVKLMNAAGVIPAVSRDERCCGHDLFWSGDETNFTKLAKLNNRLIEESGAKTVVFSCPEGFRTFKQEYPLFLGDLKYDVMHISQYLLKLVEEGKLKFTKEIKEPVTYHDGCRLGRHMGVYDAPRKLISKVPGVTLIEMERTRESGACCGVSAFLNCNSATKQMQIERMIEAKNTGAAKMLTFCPKCQIHFRCAIHDKIPVEREKVDIQIEDATVFLANAL